MNNYITDIEELELWKPVTIKGYEHYWVSNEGRVLNSRTGRFLKLSSGRDEYPYVALSSKGNVSVVRVHRLVGLAWIPNPDNKKTINHIDGRKTNNHVDNLEWMTMQENIRHACDTGLSVYHMDKLLVDKEKIEEMLLQGLTYTDIAKVYDCHHYTIKRFVMDNNLRESRYASRITDNQVQEAYKLLSKGENLVSIGRSLGVSRNTVRRHLNKFYGKSHIDEIMLTKIN